MSMPDPQPQEERDGGRPATDDGSVVEKPAAGDTRGKIDQPRAVEEPVVGIDEPATEATPTEEAAADDGAARRVRAWWLVAGAAIAAALVWVLALTIGPGQVDHTPQAPPVVPPAAPTLVPGRGSEGTEAGPRLAQQGPAQSSAETGFLGEVRKDEGVALDDANAVGIAYQACAALRSGGTRASVEAAVVDAGTPDPKAVDALVGAAVQNMCPDEKDRPVARDMRDGAYRVGVDVEAGKYVAPGGDGCSWIRSKTPGENLANVIDSGSGANGSATVTLEGGQYFVSSRCGDWKKG